MIRFTPQLSISHYQLAMNYQFSFSNVAAGCKLQIANRQSSIASEGGSAC
jgi:hypothetical protein